MGMKRWKSLSPTHSARCCEEGVAVWEQALAEENRRALAEGWQLAHEDRRRR